MIPRKRFRRAAPAPRPEVRSISYRLDDDSVDVSRLFGGGTEAGVPVNERVALAVAAWYAGVNIIASKFASVDFYVAERDGRNATVPAPDHPADWLISGRPNDWQTNYAFRQTAMVHLLNSGNAYAEIVRAGRRPVALELMKPSDVSPEWDDAKRLHYHLSNGRTLKPSDVLHFRGLGTDGVRGLHPIRLHAETLGLAVASRTTQSAIYANGCRVGGILEIPGNVATPKALQMEADFNDAQSGPYRAGAGARLEGGVKWHPNTMTPVDSDLIAGRNYDVADIARILNMPPGMLGITSDGTAANSEDEQLQFYQQTLFPLIKMAEEEYRAKLFGPYEFGRFAVIHDPMSLIRGNLAAMASWCETLFKMSSIAPDEVRGRFSMMPTGNTKTYLETNNFTAVADVNGGMLAPAPAPAPAPAGGEPAPVAPPEETRTGPSHDAPCGCLGQIDEAATARPGLDIPEHLVGFFDRDDRDHEGETRAKGGSGGCGTGAGGFKAGNKCAGTGGKSSRRGSDSSIGDHAQRSPLDLARDAFSDAKLDHKAARSAHAKAPSDETAKGLATARELLGMNRVGYAKAHEGGKIEPRPLDSRDPRIRALRADRQEGRAPHERDHPDRVRREDAVLLKTPSGLPVVHHHGEAPPKFAKEEAAEVKAVAKKVEKLKPLSPEEDATAARYVDQKVAGMAGSSAGRTYLTYDRLTGEHGYHVSDYQMKFSPRPSRRIRSGRYDVLKAYEMDGKEIPIDANIRAHLAKPHPFESNQ